MPSIPSSGQALPSIAKHCQALPSIAKHCQALPSIINHSQGLPSNDQNIARIIQIKQNFKSGWNHLLHPNLHLTNLSSNLKDLEFQSRSKIAEFQGNVKFGFLIAKYFPNWLDQAN